MLDWVCILSCLFATVSEMKHCSHTVEGCFIFAAEQLLFPVWQTPALNTPSCLCLRSINSNHDCWKMKQLAINYPDKPVSCREQKKGDLHLNSLWVCDFFWPSTFVLHFPNRPCQNHHFSSAEEGKRAYIISQQFTLECFLGFLKDFTGSLFSGI